MATDTQSLKIIGAWLSRLAGFTKAPNDKAMTKETMADLAIMLGKEFPSPAFTSDSLQAIAGDIEWFPAYATLRAAVAIWWAEHRPQQRRIAGPPGVEDLPKMDQLWFAFYHKRIGEIEGGRLDANGVKVDAFAGRGNSADARRNLASLVRKNSPAAWKIISGSDDTRREPTDADREAVAESTRRAIAALAEHRSGAQPSASIGEQLAAVKTAMGAGYKPKPLTPEQLAAVRKQQLGGASGLAP